MENQVINVTGSRCPPQSDKEFNKWYDEVHIPINMRFKGLLSVIRYRLVRFSDWAIEKNYPQYLTFCRLRDLETFNAWNVSPEQNEASEGARELIDRLGWRVQYESVKTWGSTLPLSAITFLGSDCPPERVAKYLQWVIKTHIPNLFAFKGLEGVERCRLSGSTAIGVKSVKGLASQISRYPGHFTVHYFEDTATADAYDVSEERAREMANSQEMIKELGISQVWRAQYTPMNARA